MMTMAVPYEFTIIVPVYNEFDNMRALSQRLGEYVSLCPRKACVLFVDDGSTDGSLEEIKTACKCREDFFYISFEHNAGLSAAIKAGIDAVQTPLLGYIDADLQTAPEDFDLLLELIDSCTMVTGIRQDRQDAPGKRIQSRIANAWRRLMTGDGAADSCCPLKVLHTDAARQIPFFKGMHRFLPALILLQEGGTYRQVPVRHFPRCAGKSKFNLRNRLWGPLADCFAYRWMKKRSIRYSIASSKMWEP